MPYQTKSLPIATKLSKLAVAIALINSAPTIAAPLTDNTGPTGGSSTTATITYDSATSTTINQHADVATINWSTFDVGKNHVVTFNQDATDVAINNIGDSKASDIFGTINADGTIFLSNTNGFIFGVDSVVNTGAFLATTSDITFNEHIELEDNAADSSSITINNGANISANNQVETGYLAFISKNIVTEGAADSSGLSASSGDILISNDVSSTIKLAGLNINFPESSFTGASNTNLDLTDANIAAERVILTSSGLSDILDSVVTLPSSITTADLIVSAPTLGEVSVDQDINSVLSESIHSTINSGNSNHLNIESLTINDTGSNDFSLEKNINIKENVDLTINTGSIDFTNGNVLGSQSALTVNADDVNIGDFDQDFGGTYGLNSLTINSDNTVLKGNIHTSNNITINSNIIVNRNLEDGEDGPIQTKLRSDSGDVLLSGGDLSFTSSNGDLGDLYIIANNISLQETYNFSSIKLNANNVILNGNIDSSDTISIDNTTNDYVNIQVMNDVTLSSNAIEFEDFSLTSSNSTNTLTLNAIADGSIKLINSEIYQGNDLNVLKSLIISNANSDSNVNTTNRVLISGSFNNNEFLINQNTSSNTFNLELDDNTSFSDINTFDIQNASLSGEYTLELNGDKEATSSTHFETVSDLNALIISGFNSTTLSGHISTQESGLSIRSDHILIDDSSSLLATDSGVINTLSISNNDGGDISLNGDISSSDSSNKSNLFIDSKNSDVYIGDVDGLNSITINKQLQDEGSTLLNGSINTEQYIDFSNLGVISSNNDMNLSTTSGTGDSIVISDSFLSAESHIVSLSSTSLTLDKITAKNIHLNADSISLNADLTASEELTFLNGSDSKLVDVTLINDLSLTGEIDFLATNNSQVRFSGDKSLAITASNNDIYLATFSTTDGINSLAVTAGTSESAANLYFSTDSSGNLALPDLDGAEGLSLLGNINLSIGKDQIFDTSSYNGNLDFSGTNITGTGEITFNTGTGELSLGNIGTTSGDESFSALNILSTGKLNVYGDLNINTELFNFSNLNSIELHTDLTLGSTDLPATINFGTATINGTHSLTLYSSELTLGTVGNNISLQNLEIVNTGEAAFNISNDITVVGTIDIQSTNLTLDGIVSSTGLDVNISSTNDLVMTESAEIHAEHGDIALNSSTGNIGIGKLFADDSVTVRSESGYLYNNVGDYISDSNTSINITSENQYLYGLTNIGESVASPIVIDVQNSGTITAESTGTIYIANLANAAVDATGRVINGSTGGETASIDAFTQFKLASLNTTNLPTISSNLGLISNLTWQVDEDKSIRSIKTPISAPSFYYSRNGWRLGQK